MAGLGLGHQNANIILDNSGIYIARIVFLCLSLVRDSILSETSWCGSAQWNRGDRFLAIRFSPGDTILCIDLKKLPVLPTIGGRVRGN